MYVHRKCLCIDRLKIIRHLFHLKTKQSAIINVDVFNRHNFYVLAKICDHIVNNWTQCTSIAQGVNYYCQNCKQVILCIEQNILSRHCKHFHLICFMFRYRAWFPQFARFVKETKQCHSEYKLIVNRKKNNIFDLKQMRSYMACKV